MQDSEQNPFDGLNEHVLLYMNENIFPALRIAGTRFASEMKGTPALKNFLKSKNIKPDEGYKFPGQTSQFRMNRRQNSAPDVNEDEEEEEEDIVKFDPLDTFIEIMQNLAKNKHMPVVAQRSQSVSHHAYMGGQRRGTVFCNSYKEVEKIIEEGYDAPYYPKTASQEERLNEILKKATLTKRLSKDELKTILGSMQLKSFGKDEFIIKQGDDGLEYYIIEEGECDCFIKNLDEPEKKIRTLHPGDGFGELALMYNAPRSATIKTTTPCKVWALDRTTFKVELMRMNTEDRNIQMSFIDKVPLFGGLSNYEKVKLLDGIDVQDFKEGDFIVREGEIGNDFYIIEAGQVKCLKKDENGNKRPIRQMGPGDYFGELALVTGGLRSLTVKAQSDCKVMVVNRDTFDRILGNIKKLFMRIYEV